MEMTVFFPGNKKVAGTFKGHDITSDQPLAAGGDGSAPSPFDYFIASIGLCAGYYILAFCRERGIDTGSIRLVQEFEMDPEKHLITRFSLNLQLPPDFPEKYKKAVVRAAEKCTVKRHLQNPPEIDIKLA